MTWHDDVRGLTRVEDLLGHITERAVRELGVSVAVARARPHGTGVPLRASWRTTEHPAEAPRPPPAGELVAAPRLPVRAWWPGPDGPTGYASALLVDLSGDPGGDPSGHPSGHPSDGATRVDDAACPRLDLYADTPDFFGLRELVGAAQFASYAALSLRAVERVAHLWEALETRATISQAQGILMERFDLTAEVAMSTLRRLSQHSNCPVRDLALDIIGRASPHPESAPEKRPLWTQ